MRQLAMSLAIVGLAAACDLLYAAAGGDGTTSARKWQETGQRTVVTITDAEAQPLAQSGSWRLGGTLEVRLDGRVMPHENSVIVLFGKGVEAIEGEFDHLALPEGWRGERVYDRKAPSVLLRNLRPDRAPAFPGAEGFGKFAVGGRGGRVIEVTNLDDDGPGSFRAACAARGPRIVVFRLSGTIALNSRLVIREPFITIAGQTAPGDGICIRDHQVKIDTDHVVVRSMRFRPGDVKGVEHDGFGGEGDHIIIDHCSVSWSVDEALSINKASNLTVQWCMVTESLYDSIHRKGTHGYGGLWGGPGGSWHHNVLAHHSSRNPRASGNRESGLIDVRNNLIYNWGFNSAYGGEIWPRNWINNYYKYGPATRPNVRRRIFVQRDAQGRMYADGNFVWGFPEVSADNWRGGIDFHPQGDASEATLRAAAPFVVAPVRTQRAEEAFELVLRQAGASLARDRVDARIVDEIRTGTARFGASWSGGAKGIIDSQEDVGGWPRLKSLPAPADGDHDGMPDAWERRHGLDPSDPGDGPGDRDGDGYTNVEEYINGLVSMPY